MNIAKVDMVLHMLQCDPTCPSCLLRLLGLHAREKRRGMAVGAPCVRAGSRGVALQAWRGVAQ
jgi:hypothetical protein